MYKKKSYEKNANSVFIFSILFEMHLITGILFLSIYSHYLFITFNLFVCLVVMVAIIFFVY